LSSTWAIVADQAGDDVGTVVRRQRVVLDWYAHAYAPPPRDRLTAARAQRRVKRERLSKRQARDLPLATPITAGRVHFVRRVAAAGTISCLGETWKVSKRLVGVRVSALRFWEQQGLLQPIRENGSKYRLYDEQQLRRLGIVALLRQANYDFAAIRTTLDELEAGQSQRAVAAVEQRRSELASMSWRCLEAMAAFYAYISEFLDGQREALPKAYVRRRLLGASASITQQADGAQLQLFDDADSEAASSQEGA
jgi:DNA-binding transcriptional MerR regulator